MDKQIKFLSLAVFAFVLSVSFSGVSFAHADTDGAIPVREDTEIRIKSDANYEDDNTRVRSEVREETRIHMDDDRMDMMEEDRPEVRQEMREEVRTRIETDEDRSETREEVRAEVRSRREGIVTSFADRVESMMSRLLDRYETLASRLEERIADIEENHEVDLSASSEALVDLRVMIDEARVSVEGLSEDVTAFVSNLDSLSGSVPEIKEMFRVTRLEIREVHDALVDIIAEVRVAAGLETKVDS